MRENLADHMRTPPRTMRAVRVRRFGGLAAMADKPHKRGKIVLEIQEDQRDGLP